MAVVALAALIWLHEAIKAAIRPPRCPVCPCLVTAARAAAPSKASSPAAACGSNQTITSNLLLRVNPTRSAAAPFIVLLLRMQLHQQDKRPPTLHSIRPERNSPLERGGVIKAKGGAAALRPRPLQEPKGFQLNRARTRTRTGSRGRSLQACVQKDDPGGSALPVGDPRII